MEHGFELLVSLFESDPGSLCSQCCEDARFELLIGERLGEVVVRSYIQTRNAVLDLALDGQHDDRDLLRLTVRLEPAAHRKPVHVAHHDVQKDDIRILGPRDLHPINPGLGPRDGVPHPHERIDDGAALGLAVFNKKNTGLHVLAPK